MNEKIRELRQERAGLITKARELVDKADTEKRDMTGEERTSWEKFMGDIDKLDEKIKVAERMAALENEQRESHGKQDPKPQGGGEKRESIFETDEYRSAFEKRMRFGRDAEYTPEEVRAIQAGVASEGGNTVAPQQFIASLLKGLDNDVVIRSLATKISLTTSDSIGVPTLDTEFDDADWTTELATGKLDENLTFGKRQLKPNPVAKRTKVSNTLLRVSALPIEQIIRDRLQYKFAVTQEKGFMTGNGVDKPLGIFAASNDGIPTSRDVVCGSATDPTYDGLIDCKFALKAGYWKDPSTRWVWNKDTIKKILKIKDLEGRYILDPNSAVADNVLDIPYVLSEYAPNTFTTGQYVGVLGAFRYYWIADLLGMTIQRLVELYSENNQTGFIGRLECDGQPVLAEAFVRAKLG